MEKKDTHLDISPEISQELQIILDYFKQNNINPQTGIHKIVQILGTIDFSTAAEKQHAQNLQINSITENTLHKTLDISIKQQEREQLIEKLKLSSFNAVSEQEIEKLRKKMNLSNSPDDIRKILKTIAEVNNCPPFPSTEFYELIINKQTEHLDINCRVDSESQMVVLDNGDVYRIIFRKTSYGTEIVIRHYV